MKMTPKQKAFADYFIECGNQTEAAIKAGYSKKSAKQVASENMTKPYLVDYIDQRLKEIESKRIASIEEVMCFFTSVMRGEVKDQFDLDAALKDRLDAAKALDKRIGLSAKEQRARIEHLKAQTKKLEEPEKDDGQLSKVDLLLKGLQEDAKR